MSSCNSCGTEITPVTYDINKGLCMLCKQGAKVCENCGKKKFGVLDTKMGNLCMGCALSLGAIGGEDRKAVTISGIFQIPKWLDAELPSRLPKKVVGLSFNITGNMKDECELTLIGTPSYARDDPDWACDDVWSISPCQIQVSSDDWEDTLEEIKSVLTEYLARGSKSKCLKASQGIGVGHVSGDLHVIWEQSA